MYSTAHWQLGDVMVSDITFLWFLLFSMCHSLHVAVNKCINWCFVHLFPIRPSSWLTAAKFHYLKRQRYLNLPFKFCVDRVSIQIFGISRFQKFCKFGIKCLFSPPQKNHVLGEFWPPKLHFLSSRLPESTSLRRSTRFELSLVVIGPTVWSGREVKSTKKERTLSRPKPKFAIFADILSVLSHQPNFACWVVSRISFLILIFRKIGWKCGSSGGSNFWLSHWLVIR